MTVHTCGFSVRTCFRFEKFCVRVVGATRKVHVLADVLAFVMVLFQSGDFEYTLVYSGWAGGKGAVVHICKLIVYEKETSLGA